MSAFHDVIFPLRLAFGASGGPTRKTDITQFASGHEHRNSPHAASRRRYNAATGIKSRADMETLIAFFEARHGQLYSFRFKDPFDHHVKGGVIGIGDGQETAFQLSKLYADSAGGYRRNITKPRPDSTAIFIDGQPVLPADVSVNTLTGVVTFSAPPTANADVSASFDFDVPVRFDTDVLDLSLEAFGAGEVAAIPLIEVLGHA